METMSQMYQIYMSKKAIHIVLSLVSVLSFVLVSYSSLFLPLLSTFSINFFSYSSERNYIFLLCNGILVFLIKNSGFITSSSAVVDHIKSNQFEKTYSSQVSYHTENNKVEKTIEIDIQVPGSSQVNPDLLTQKGEEEVTERKQNKILFFIADSESEEQTGQVLDIQEDDNEYYVDEEYKERVDLNKRCEEFIRKMKQDIKTEATRQLR